MKLVLVSFTLVYSATCGLVLSFHNNVCVLREALVTVWFLLRLLVASLYKHRLAASLQ